MKRRRQSADEAEINITPMLDIVFIMLIFFIVTTSFVKEDGLEVSRPSNTPPKEIIQDKEREDKIERGDKAQMRLEKEQYKTIEEINAAFERGDINKAERDTKTGWIGRKALGR